MPIPEKEDEIFKYEMYAKVSSTIKLYREIIFTLVKLLRKHEIPFTLPKEFEEGITKSAKRN